MRTGFASLAVVGIAACVAVYALTAGPRQTSLYSSLTAEDMEFLKFISQHGRSYGTKEEFELRSQIFKETLARVYLENQQPENTFTVAVNKFADWTPQEFKRILGYKARAASPKLDFAATAIPDSVDWRTKGAVNAVQDQGQCGSCWAFSAVGAMESRWEIKSGKLEKLSEQQLVDCAGGTYGNEGCNGGYETSGIQYATDKGMMTEADYPYLGYDSTCAYVKAKTIAWTLAGFDNVATNNAQALKTAIADGPTTVAIEADTFVFQFYSGGILNSKACGTNLDHAVVAVGYGADASGKPYYIVRNSWGASWGLSGYVNIAIVDGAGICGIQMEPAYPIFN